MKNKKLLPDFDKCDGLLPVIVQDSESLEILMTAFMNEEAYCKTFECGEMVYFSRSRQKLWHKGESSGNTQQVVELRIDCDSDALLAKVIQKGGAACHTGHRSCFYRVLEGVDSARVEGHPIFDPAKVYGKK